MIELRCERRIHAELDGRGVLWELCRECSRDKSTATVKRKVYHRWDLRRTPPERLKDIVYNDRRHTSSA